MCVCVCVCVCMCVCVCVTIFENINISKIITSLCYSK